jgi:hypothetical protein
MTAGSERGPRVIWGDPPDAATRIEAACKRLSERVWQALCWLDDAEREAALLAQARQEGEQRG